MTTTAKHMTGKSSRKVATTKATEQAQAKVTKAKAPAQPKAPKAKAPAKAPAQPKAPKPRGLQGTVVINDPKFVFGAEGSVRRRSWDALAKLPAAQRTLAAYKAAGGLTKYIKRWQAAGVITVKGAA